MHDLTSHHTGRSAPYVLPALDGASDGDRPPAAEVERLRAELRALQEKVDNLEIALASSRQIGAAIGILMTQRRITDTAAFDLLREVSQRRHRKLREVAAEVLYTGALDHPTPISA